MKVAIVGTYPAGTFEKFKNYFSEKPEIEVVEVDTQEKFDALIEADAVVLRILKMPKEVVARIKGLKMIMRWGAGFDSVDIEEAGKHGIYVSPDFRIGILKKLLPHIPVFQTADRDLDPAF